MKQKKGRIAGLIIMVVLTLGILLVPAKTSKAVGSYKYGTFAVTALSSTAVTIDYRSELEDYSDATVYGFDIYAEDLTLDTGEILIRQAAANEVFGTLTELTPGHTYQVIVKIHYQYLGSDADYGYSFVQFTTPLSGVSSEVDVVTDSGISAPVTDPSAEQPSVQQPQPQAPAVISVAAPSVASVKMVGANVAATVTPVVCDGYEFGIFNKSTDALVKTESTILNGVTFYGVSRKNVYIMRAKAYAYDSAGNKVYSAWGAGQYFVPQPQIRKTASKLKKNSINLKWNKVSGAQNYTIYMRKRGSGKWYKVKTVSGKKASYKITKFRGKGFNTHRQNYEVNIKATAKIGGRTYSSTTNDYIYTYTYTRYR